MARHACGYKVFHFLLGHTFAILEDYASHNFLAVFFVGNANDLHVANLGTSIDEFFDFLGINVFTATNDHILEASCDAIIAVFVSASEVARMEPTVGIDSRCGCLRHFVVALHNVVSASHELTVDTVGTIFARFGIDNLAFHVRKCATDCLGTNLQRIVIRTHRASGRSLGLTVNRDDFFHIHNFGRLFHQVCRTVGACHNTDAHIGEIGFCKVGMLHHSNEHGRHTVEHSNVFIVHARQSRLGRKIRERQHRSTVCHRCCHREHHAKAMEHRDLNHHTVSRRKIHMVADIFTVVDYVIVCQHNPLGESRCAGCILHIANIIFVDSGSHTVNFTYGNLRRTFESIIPIHASLLLKSNGNDVAQERQTLAVQSSTGF